MIQTIKKAWGIPELRKKIVFTALILLIFRIGNAIPVPYVDTGLLGTYINQLSTTVLSLYNVMSGGAFAQATIFALGVQPYINSSIIIQLLTIAIPSLGRMAQEGGEEGKKKIQSITRYATVAIAIIQGVGYFFLMKNYGILTSTSVWAALVIIVSFIAGSSFVMWMGEQITEFGIGNGISIILFAGILSRVPTMVSQMVGGMRAGSLKWWMALLVIVGILLLFFVYWQLYVHGGRGGGARLQPVGVACGFGAGLLGTGIALDGPPMAAFGLAVGWEPRVFLGTVSVFFMLRGIITLVLQWWHGFFTPEVLGMAMYGTPGVMLGSLAAFPVVKRINVLLFRRVLLAIIAICGVVCLVRSIW